MREPVLDEHHFDGLYADSSDPWGYRSRWYEARKRALILAALPRPRFHAAIETGCANGELAAALAPRCSALLACDFHDKAVGLAQARLAGLAHVRVERRKLPQDWPPQRFDLVVMSELGYYLQASALMDLARATVASLAPDGVLLACHWRHPVDDAFLRGDEVHHVLHGALGLKRQLAHIERDLRIDVWCGDDRSVAQREGLA